MTNAVPTREGAPVASGRALSDIKRTQILSAARLVFMEDGFDGASMQRITELSGVSKATVYNHFPSKDLLFEAVLREQVSDVREQAFTLRDRTGQPAEVLFGMGVSLVTGILHPQNLKMTRQLVSDGWRFPHLGRAFMAEGPTRGTELLADYLRAVCAQGLLRIDDHLLAAQQFVALAEVHQANHAHMTGDVPTAAQIEARVRSAVQLFMRGYAP
jgi:TetR/AcrR family transcriptional regulator, mexJK operon transcriptional repressor